MIDAAGIRQKALAEIKAEDERAAIDAEKARIREKRTLWQKIFPFEIKITIKKRSKPCH